LLLLLLVVRRVILFIDSTHLDRSCLLSLEPLRIMPSADQPDQPDQPLSSWLPSGIYFCLSPADTTLSPLLRMTLTTAFLCPPHNCCSREIEELGDNVLRNLAFDRMLEQGIELGSFRRIHWNSHTHHAVLISLVQGSSPVRHLTPYLKSPAEGPIMVYNTIIT
jgi:hypothetical protein